MKIDHNSYGSVALVYLIGGALAALLILFVHNPWVFWPLLVLILLIVGWQTAFFRVPRRFRAGGPNSVVSVADGKVVIAEKVFEPEFLKRDCIQISVYMDFFDVHANFWPADGEVAYYRYYPGEHFLAFKPKASEENEHTCVGLRTPSGHSILFKQLAGGFARRIVCYAQDGLPVKAGEQCGIIKFGSRIDMYVPLDAKICVKVGEQVRACETVIAEL